MTHPSAQQTGIQSEQFEHRRPVKKTDISVGAFSKYERGMEILCSGVLQCTEKVFLSFSFFHPSWKK